MSLKINFSWMMGSKIIQMLAGFICGALINRALGPSYRGIFAEMQTWVFLLVMLCGFSMDSAIYHFANRSLYGTHDKSRFVTILWLSIVFSALSVLILTLLNLFSTNLLSSAIKNNIILLDLWMISIFLSANLIIFIQSIGNIKLSAIIGVTTTIIQLLIIVIGYFIGIINFFFILISLFILNIISITMIFFTAWKSDFLSGSFSRDLSKGIIKAGLKIHIATISTFTYMKVNQLIVFNYCGDHEAGNFAVALNLCMALMVIPSTFQVVLYPRVIHASDDYEITVRSMRIGFYFWGLIILFLVLFARPILLMYAGYDFLPSANIYRILMISTWLLPISSLLAPYFIKKGAFIMASASAVILGVTSIGLNFHLVPKYAAIGAGIATSVSCLIGFGLILCFLWYLSKKNPFVIFIPKFADEWKALKSSTFLINRLSLWK